LADHVFEDRVGLWIVDPTRGVGRLQAIRAFGGGIIRDLFLPRTATRAHFGAVRKAGLNAHLYEAVAGLSAEAYVARVLDDVATLQPGAVDLDIELGEDAPMPAFVEAVVRGVRAVRPNLRLRLNFAPWKGFAVPAELLATDPNLYVCAQNYLGNMDELLSPVDVLADLLAHRAPPYKATVCYAAACTVLGSSGRLRTLPDLSRAHRGTIYQDDLMADTGLL